MHRRRRLPTFSPGTGSNNDVPATPPKPRANGFNKILSRRLYLCILLVVIFFWSATVQIYTNQKMQVDGNANADGNGNGNGNANANGNANQDHRRNEMQPGMGVGNTVQKQIIRDDVNANVNANANMNANANVKEPIPTMDLDHVPHSLTGAFANCTSHTYALAPSSHPHQQQMTISCHTLSYRVDVESLITMSSSSSSSKPEPIVIGVLSSAGGDGPKRRTSIRQTWAEGHTVLFLVAGPWEDIADEYDAHRDMIWINEEEVYDGERSVLTYKTLSFVKVVHKMATDFKLDIQYAFKTDDDSYVHVQNLYEHFFERNHDEYNFWGWCPRKKFKPLRDEKDKWAVSFDVYPEPLYPRYCQGAGFALSRKFIDCAAAGDGGKGQGQGEGGHISNMRFMPFEDVAMGLIAQRCNVIPTMTEDKRLLHMYRTDTSEERKRVNGGFRTIGAEWLTIPDMKGRIVQHRIHSAWDMFEHHKCALDPDGYKEKTNIQWYVKPKRKFPVKQQSKP